MDNTEEYLRGWRDSLFTDAALSPGKRQDYSRIIEKYLLAAETNGDIKLTPQVLRH